MGISSVKVGHPHDEIIDKLDRHWKESSSTSSEKPLVNDIISIGRLHIIGIENDFTKMYFLSFHSTKEGGIPHIVGAIKHLSRNIELNWQTRSAIQVHASDKQHYVVTR